MTELKKLQAVSNQEEYQRIDYIIKNRCIKCKKCLFDDIVEESKINTFLLEFIPQKGDVCNKNNQCKKTISIINS